MEKPYSKCPSIFSLMSVILLLSVLSAAIILKDLVLIFMYVYRFMLHAWKLYSKRETVSSIVTDQTLTITRREIEMVMEKLGKGCDPDGERLKERMGVGEICAMFEEDEPWLEEVREAFEVFDENKDGFIDEKELKKVISGLDFGVFKCEKMIKAYDEDGDGRIDFDEFVKILENSFC